MPERMQVTTPQHRLQLPGGPWDLWRCMVLRGAGFPAHRVLGLATKECGEIADRLLDREKERQSLQDQALSEVHRALDELRDRGEWEDKSQRKPLMKAMQALTKGKLPKASWSDLSEKQMEEIRGAEEELSQLRSEYERAYDAAVLASSRELASVARWEPFREAVTWQNRNAVRTAIDNLARNGGEPSKGARKSVRGSQKRQHEELVASYLQRYCVKNDSIGFFGPIGWAHVVDDDRSINVRPGKELLARREVYFENWCINALAQSLEREYPIRAWLAPRLRSGLFINDSTLYRPFGAPIKLLPDDARLIELCDSRHTAKAIAAQLIADPLGKWASEGQVFEAIESYCKKRVLAWSLGVPLESRPDRLLRQLLERIEPEDLKTATMTALETFEEARAAVAAAAGNADALDSALQRIEKTFQQLTRMAPRRALGQAYAARGLVYEDCRRDIDVRFGREMIGRLGPPLSLVLTAAQWLAGRMSRELDEKLKVVYTEQKRKSKTGLVDCYPFFGQALSEYFISKDRSWLSRIEEEYLSRWAKALAIDTDSEGSFVERAAEELRGRVEELFWNQRTAWSLTRHFSPDVMISASSEEAIRRGEYQLVLGEIHAGNTMAQYCFVSQHPNPESLVKAVEEDSECDSALFPKGIDPNRSQRVTMALVPESFYVYEYADEPRGPMRYRPVPVGSLVVEDDGELVQVRSRDGRLSFNAIDLFGATLNQECIKMVGTFLPRGRHSPRVTVDHVVVSREKWRFSPKELEFALIKSPQERFFSFRRWARSHGLPRFLFYKVESEKPCYLDMDSPIYVDMFAKVVRKGIEEDPEGSAIVITEMIPRADQTWLPDKEGNSYTSELRIAAVSRASTFSREPLHRQTSAQVDT